MASTPSGLSAPAAFRKAALLPELLADHLREEIASGALPPGRRLVEQELAGALRVSRVPLREAFRILCSEGLVTLSPHRGAEVSGTSQEELEELFEVRAMIEARAAALAASRASPDHIAQLEQQVARMAAAIRGKDTVAYYRASAAFHDDLVDAAGNRSLARVYAQVKVRFRRYQMVLAAVAESPARSNQEHASVLKAITNRDPAAASALAEDHIEALVRRYRKAQSSQARAAARAFAA
jgi:DNA-binding GntR family transcriptional regulator